jgi:ketosteroid isomerase-like protein
MPTTIDDTSRTARLLALMKKGDDAFNARDFAAVDAVHHPDMVAYITGLAEPVYGREAHAAAMQQLLRMSRHARVQRPVPGPVREAATGSPSSPAPPGPSPGR